MSKDPLHLAQPMSEAAIVDQAATWARELTNRESRGPGDIENAWLRLEARYGIPYATFWSLRYRKPKAIFGGLLSRLHAAYCAECERQMRLLGHELERTKEMAAPDNPVVVAAEAVVGAARSRKRKAKARRAA